MDCREHTNAVHGGRRSRGSVEHWPWIGGRADLVLDRCRSFRRLSSLQDCSGAPPTRCRTVVDQFRLESLSRVRSTPNPCFVAICASRVLGVKCDGTARDRLTAGFTGLCDEFCAVGGWHYSTQRRTGRDTRHRRGEQRSSITKQRGVTHRQAERILDEARG